MPILRKVEQDLYHNKLCDMSWSELATEEVKLHTILANASNPHLSLGVSLPDEMRAREKLQILDAWTIQKMKDEDVGEVERRILLHEGNKTRDENRPDEPIMPE